MGVSDMSVSDPRSCASFWSPIAAAGPESALSGVLAGFVFAGIVVILSTKPSPDSRQDGGKTPRSYALQLLTTAFIIFALDSYFTSISAGELACNRAYAESILSGGVLGTGAIMLVVGLSWLLVTYSDNSDEIRLLLTAIIVGIWVVVILMLALSGMGEGQAMLTNRNQYFVDIVPYVIAVSMGVIIFVAARRVKSPSEADLRPKVLRAALTALSAAIISALFTGVASAFSATWWLNPPPWAVDVIVVLSMLVPEVALVASVAPATAALTREQSGGMLGGTTHKWISWSDQLRLLGINYRRRVPSSDTADSPTSSTDIEGASPGAPDTVH
jgi:hypothetical protein